MKTEIQEKVCIHCGEEFKEKEETFAVECQQCIAIDYQE